MQAAIKVSFETGSLEEREGYLWDAYARCGKKELRNEAERLHRLRMGRKDAFNELLASIDRSVPKDEPRPGGYCRLPIHQIPA